MTTKKAAAIKPFALADFFTLDALVKGKELPVPKPDGSASGFNLLVMGSDAPAARKALLEATRILRDGAKDDITAEEEAELSHRANLHYRSALAFGWDFPVPHSPEAITDLLLNNPGLAVEVEKLASDRARFFA